MPICRATRFGSMLRQCLILPAFAVLLMGAASYEPRPWLDDLHQAQQAFAAFYANFDWAVFTRKADLAGLFGEARQRIVAARSDRAASAAFDRLIRDLGDAHVVMEWPDTTAAAAHAPAVSRICLALGYEGTRTHPGFLQFLPGYSAIPAAAEFPAGIVAMHGHRLGIVRIGLFDPSGTPALCEAASAALNVSPAQPCDDMCADRIEAWATARMTDDLAATIASLRSGRIDTLLVDITGNGGGSDWAEAAARMVTRTRLVSERLGFVRGAHWAGIWLQLANDLRKARAGAGEQEAKEISGFVQAAEAKAVSARLACSSRAFWQGRRPACPWLGDGGFASGLLGAAGSESDMKKPWIKLVFGPARYAFQTGVWDGPLIVAIDQASFSAAEEFSAVLQDNRAAIIIGAPTGGAGCGYTDGGTPVTLTHSGAVLKLPDCARFRSNGDNEVEGVRPDILAALRRYDGPDRKAAEMASILPQAISAAQSLRQSLSPVRPGGK